MTGLDDLARELDAWQAAGRVATIWWRDDDLGAPTEMLRPLLALADRLGRAPLLAVTPGRATLDLARSLQGQCVRVAVHGRDHLDHEAGRGKKSEFGPSRPQSEVRADLTAALHRMRELIEAPMLIPCFVPPWNRIAPPLITALAPAGYCGLSTFTPRPAPFPAPGLLQINTHVDVIDWQGTRSFIGLEATVAKLIADLVRRREGPHEATHEAAHEPTGLLTHHLDMVREDWHALGEILNMIETRPGGDMVDAGTLWQTQAPDPDHGSPNHSRKQLD